MREVTFSFLQLMFILQRLLCFHHSGVNGDPVCYSPGRIASRRSWNLTWDTGINSELEEISLLFIPLLWGWAPFSAHFQLFAGASYLPCWILSSLREEGSLVYFLISKTLCKAVPFTPKSCWVIEWQGSLLLFVCLIMLLRSIYNYVYIHLVFGIFGIQKKFIPLPFFTYALRAFSLQSI